MIICKKDKKSYNYMHLLLNKTWLLSLMAAVLFFCAASWIAEAAAVSKEKTSTVELNGRRLHVLPAGWDFRRDVEDIGLEEKWYKPPFENKMWKQILTTRYWGRQLAAPEKLQQHAPYGRHLPGQITFHGVGWYRTSFIKPDIREDSTVTLEFGGIDESCWVFLNGKLVGEQEYSEDVDILAWDKPRRFDVTGRLKEGENHLVVRVRAMGGLAGMFGGAAVMERTANLLAEVCFTKGMPEWKYTILDIIQEDKIEKGVLNKAEHGFFIEGEGEYAEEKSLIVRVPAGKRVRLYRTMPEIPEDFIYYFDLSYRQILNEHWSEADEKVPLSISFNPEESVIKDQRLHSPLSSLRTWESLRSRLDIDREAEGVTIELVIELSFPGTYFLGGVYLGK